MNEIKEGENPIDNCEHDYETIKNYDLGLKENICKKCGFVEIEYLE